MSDPIHKRHRQSTRLRTYDYASDGAYFITCCTHEKTRLFGDIVDGKMRLGALGEIVLEEWHRSSEIRKEIRLDAFFIMPNHIHGIVWIQHEHSVDDNVRTPDGVDGVGAHGRAPLQDSDLIRPARSLGSFVAGFKSAITKRINESRGTPGQAVWQRNFHDRVVRVEQELEKTRQYIVDNPLKWHLDEENRHA